MEFSELVERLDELIDSAQSEGFELLAWSLRTTRAAVTDRTRLYAKRGEIVPRAVVAAPPAREIH